MNKNLSPRFLLNAISLWAATTIVPLSALAQNSHQDTSKPISPSTQTRLTSVQQKQVDQFVDRFERSCLAGPTIPENASKFIKTSLEWARDPAICSCSSKRLRAAIIPEVFAYNDKQMEQFMQHFSMTDVAECGVPIIKERMLATCEVFMREAFDQTETEKAAKRIAELGYSDLDSFLKGTCGCMRTSLKDITPKQWVDSTMVRYEEYLERKRTGKPAGKAITTPMDEAMSSCIKKN